MIINKMNRVIYIGSIIAFLLISINFANAHGEEDFAKAEELIKQKISCSELTDEQLELIGDYYMEQMHPGELHEIMDERMGGEGSESLRQVHINIARAFYCGEHGAMPNNMMNIMMGRSGMMGYGNYYAQGQNYGYNTFLIILSIFIFIVLILLIALLIKQSQKTERRHNKR